MYSRISKYGGIFELNIQNEARIYAKLFFFEYNLLWAGLFFIGGLSFVGVPTGTDLATPMNFNVDQDLFNNQDQMFTQYFVTQFRPQLGLIALDFGARMTDPHRLERALLAQFRTKQMAPSGLPGWAEGVDQQLYLLENVVRSRGYLAEYQAFLDESHATLIQFLEEVSIRCCVLAISQSNKKCVTNSI